MKYKTVWTKKEEVERKWYVIDVKDQILGRSATKIASLLIGKEKPEIVPGVDCGDYVVVINSDDVKLTRGKELKKTYFRHSGYPGAAKFTRFDEQIKKDSRKVIVDAVKNMLPNNKLRDKRLARLFVYKNSEHKHTAQKPIEIKL
ncbi:MAG: 50S ribosomal protein L13 [Candidatus Dojkabacteria bacterium]|jgi:large subunit ribosomal protein L13